MDLKKAETLLEKYWNGETSAEEEKWLKQNMEALRQAGLKAPESVYFDYIKSEQSKPGLGQTFDEEILGIIQEKNKPQGSVWLKSWYWQAAAIALLISIGVLFRNGVFEQKKEQNVVMVDTYDDPQKAFEATKMALLLISEKLNKGEEFTTKIQKINELEQSVKSN
jgi:hypothetical protein